MRDWLRRVIRRILSLFRSDVIVDDIVGEHFRKEYYWEVEPAKQFEIPRRGIRSTDLGIRKLRRHRGGRQYDLRSGFDPNKRMVDIEDGQTRKPTKKKKGWAEDRKN